MYVIRIKACVIMSKGLLDKFCIRCNGFDCCNCNILKLYAWVLCIFQIYYLLCHELQLPSKIWHCSDPQMGVDSHGFKAIDLVLWFILLMKGLVLLSLWHCIICFSYFASFSGIVPWICGFAASLSPTNHIYENLRHYSQL